MQVISREEAKAVGLKRYYTGVPCQNGHDSERYVRNWECLLCVKGMQERLRQKREAVATHVYSTGLPCKKGHIATRYVSDGKCTVCVGNKRKAWSVRNTEKVSASNAKRRASKSKATPKWLTREQLKQMEALYLRAQIWTDVTGVPYQVDHIIPLHGTLVCGLHVPWNLRVITAEDNVRKSNRVEEDACG